MLFFRISVCYRTEMYYENIAFAQQVIEAPTRQVKSRVLSMLSMVGLLDKYKAYPNELIRW